MLTPLLREHEAVGAPNLLEDLADASTSSTDTAVQAMLTPVEPVRGAIGAPSVRIFFREVSHRCSGLAR